MVHQKWLLMIFIKKYNKTIFSQAIENIVNFYNDLEITLIGSFVSIEALKNHPKAIKTFILDKKYTSLYKISRDLGNFDAFFSFRGSIRSKFLKFLISAKKSINLIKTNIKHMQLILHLTYIKLSG